MTQTTPSTPPSAAAAAEGLVASYETAGYVRAVPAILQPAEPFLDLSGEDIRRSLFLTTDASGAELCLRPDLTIPVARDYLASARAGRPAAFCYLGPVFRIGDGKSGEFVQCGAESFGRADRAAADAEMLAMGLDALLAFGVSEPTVRAGDVALFAALTDALDLSPAWRRRLVKDFNRKISFADDLDRLTLAATTKRPEYEGVLAALAGSDRKAAHALVTDLMTIAGTTNVGGRTVAEIADRFLEQSTLTGGALPAEKRAVIEQFLAIAGDPDDVLSRLRTLAGDARLHLGEALDQFESRIGFMAARGIETSAIRFATAFGRGLDYYTGFEFEIAANGPDAVPLVAGGRYDGLMTRLGAPSPIPAVGFAIWIERLAECGRLS